MRNGWHSNEIESRQQKRRNTSLRGHRREKCASIRKQNRWCILITKQGKGLIWDFIRCFEISFNFKNKVQSICLVYDTNFECNTRPSFVIHIDFFLDIDSIIYLFFTLWKLLPNLNSHFGETESEKMEFTFCHC